MNPKLADKDYCICKGIPIIEDYVQMYSEKIEIDLTEEWDFILLTIYLNGAASYKAFWEEKRRNCTNQNAAERASGVKNLSDTAWDLVQKNFVGEEYGN